MSVGATIALVAKGKQMIQNAICHVAEISFRLAEAASATRYMT